MARKKKELPLLEKITITDVAAEGKALAKVNDLVVFVPYVVPGDVVDLQVKRKKNHYAEAVAVKFHEYSPVRAVPFCQHYGICGGCKWQCLPYTEQIKYKQKQVTDNLTRIGKIELPEISPIIGSEKTEFYRNKLEFTFSNKRWLTEEEVKEDVKYDQMNAVGFHIPGAFDKVLAIEKCWLQDDISNQIRNAIRDYAYEHNYSFFNLRSQEGMIPTVPFKEAYFLEDALRFRTEIKEIPLVYVGGLVSREKIDEVLDDGFEFVQMGRALLNEPGFVNRLRTEEKARCNCGHSNYCIARMYTIDMACHKHLEEKLPLCLEREIEKLENQ